MAAGGPLEGLARAEATGGLPAEICAWWLAALGADVSGQVHHPERASRLEAALRRPLRSMARVPLGAGDAVRVRPAWEGADLEDLATVKMTSSRKGEDLATDQAIWSSSGLAALTFATDPATAATRPCVPSSRQLPILAGTLGALVALAGLVGRAGGGSGFSNAEADLDELLTMMQMQPLAAAQLSGPESRSAGQVFPGGMFACRDGLVYARPLYPEHWALLLESTGSLPDLAREVASDPRLLVSDQKRIDSVLSDWFASQSRSKVVAAFQGQHVPLSAVNTPQQVLEDPAFTVSGMLRSSDDGLTVGLPWHSEGGPSGRGPLISGSSHEGAPLAGVRILDLTWAWAGPFATTLLGDLGAEVLNVEWEPRPSNLRVQLPKAAGAETSPNAGGWWSANQRGKRSIGINLKDEAGVELVQRLAQQSHLVMQNFAPGVVDRLGVGYPDLVKYNPSLVYVSMSAFGPELGSWTGYGPQVYTTAGGAFAMPGPLGEPSQMAIPYPDPVSGLVAAVAALAYLLAALRTGTGAYVEISEVVATCTIFLDALIDATDGVAPRPDYSVTDDGNGRYSVQTAGGGPRVPVAIASEVLESARLAERGFWLPEVTPALSGQRFRIPGAPFTVDGERVRAAAPAPTLFDDTERVLRDILSLSDAEIESLRQRHAIGISRA